MTTFAAARSVKTHSTSRQRLHRISASDTSGLSIDDCSLDEILALRPASAATKHAHKDVLCITNESSGLGDPVYIKRQWAWDRRLPRWSDWRDGVNCDPDPVREWQGLRNMQEAGLHVPVPLRLLQDNTPRSPRSAVILPAVPVSRSLAQLAAAGALTRVDPFSRRGLLVALRKMAVRIEQHRLRWRSMKAKHVYPETLADDSWRLWLIDCEGVRPRASRRQQLRDRRLFVRSVLKSGADNAFCTALMSAFGV